MSMPIVAVVGPSNSGKTTVASALVQILAARGYRVAAVKHCPHGHDTGRPNSDSARLLASGAAQVMASSPGLVTQTLRTASDWRLGEIAASVGTECDVLIAEGYKRSTAPKILVRGKEELSPAPGNVIAVVGDGSPTSDMPRFRVDEMEALATLIESDVIGRSGGAPHVSLSVDGTPVPLRSFPARILAGVISALVDTLDSVPRGARRLRVTVDTGSPADSRSRGTAEDAASSESGVGRRGAS